MSKIVGVLIPKGKSKDITSNITLPDKITSPVYEGQKIGEISYSIDNTIISNVNLIAKSTIKKINYPNMCAKTFGDWFNLLR